MDGEHIEMIISGWCSTELREKALVELGNMREELYVLRQFTRGLTPRALDAACTCPKFLNGRDTLCPVHGDHPETPRQ